MIQLKKIIFGTETFGGRLFDILLIFAITSSVLIVMLDSVSEYHKSYGNIFFQAEWIFTILFTIEYILRIYVSDSIEEIYIIIPNINNIRIILLILFSFSIVYKLKIDKNYR